MSIHPKALQALQSAGLTTQDLPGATVETELLEDKGSYSPTGPTDIYLKLANGQRVKIYHYTGNNSSETGFSRRASRYQAATYYDHVRQQRTYQTPQELHDGWVKVLGLEQASEELQAA